MNKRVVSLLLTVLSLLSVCFLYAKQPDENSPASLAKNGNTVEIEFYYSHTCEHCDSMLNEYVRPAENKYAERINVTLFDIDDEEKGTDNYSKLVEKEIASKDEGNEIPVIFMGEYVLGGSIEVRDGFNEKLEILLAENAKEPDTKPQNIAKVDTASVVEQTQDTIAVNDSSINVEEKKSVHIVYFFKKGCKHCQRVTHDLKLIKKEYPYIQIHKFDVEEEDGAHIAEHLAFLMHVPEDRHLASPMLFIGETYLLPEDITYTGIVNSITNGSEKRYENISDITDEEKEAAKNRITKRFEGFNLLTILAAGLIDGVNPCAFGVIIFFVTFLSMLKRSRKDVIITGAAFTFSVFMTYLLVGLGVLAIIVENPWFNQISKWFFLVFGAITLILAIISFIDFIRTRKGEATDMLLKMPDKIKKKVHKTIMKENSPRAKRNMILAALSTGFLISLMELTCTGQVYLPTIMLMTSSNAASLAYFYLVLYNIMFIIPLVAIFLIAVFWVSSEQLTEFLKKNTKYIKLLLAVLFLALAFLLFHNAGLI